MSTTSTMPLPRCSGSTITIHGRRSHCKQVVKAAAASARDSSVCSSERNSKKDYYKVLSLEHSAAVEEIKRAYRRLALRYHPDVCPPSRRAESTERFLELRRAYETLSDPAQRVRYDAEASRASGDGGDEQAEYWPGGVGFVARDVWEAQVAALRARAEQRQRARCGGVRSAVGRSD